MHQDTLNVIAAYHARMTVPEKGAGKESRESKDSRQSRRPPVVAALDASSALNARLLEAGPEARRFIHILARSQRTPQILELGTSYGYSTIWLADAARAAGGRVTTMELHDDRSAYARDMTTRAGLADYVDFRVGNAVALIDDLPLRVDFVLIALWKDLYVPCLDAVYPKLNAGAMIVADDMTPGTDDALRYARAVRAKPHMASLCVPVGGGMEISRYR